MKKISLELQKILYYYIIICKCHISVEACNKLKVKFLDYSFRTRVCILHRKLFNNKRDLYDLWRCHEIDCYVISRTGKWRHCRGSYLFDLQLWFGTAEILPTYSTSGWFYRKPFIFLGDEHGEWNYQEEITWIAAIMAPPRLILVLQLDRMHGYEHLKF